MEDVLLYLLLALLLYSPRCPNTIFVLLGMGLIFSHIEEILILWVYQKVRICRTEMRCSPGRLLIGIFKYLLPSPGQFLKHTVQWVKSSKEGSPICFCRGPLSEHGHSSREHGSVTQKEICTIHILHLAPLEKFGLVSGIPKTYSCSSERFCSPDTYRASWGRKI